MASKQSPCTVVIVGAPRTGTTMLNMLLGEHPELDSFGEVVNMGPYGGLRREAVSWVSQIWKDHPDALLYGLPNAHGRWGEEAHHGPSFERISSALSPPLVRNGPGLHRYLERAVRPGRVCKILYNQLPSHWAQAWSTILGAPNLRLVHSVRDNWLESYVSTMATGRARRWHHPKGKAPVMDDAPFRVGVLALADYFACIERNVTYYRHLCQRLGGLEVTYEFLVANWDEEVPKIHEFAGVEPIGMRPGTSKRTGRSAPELIINYAELADAFAGSPWERFFIEA